MKLAIYDFDGTIFEKETLPFIVKYYASNKYSKIKLVQFYAKLLKLTAIYKLKLNPSLDKEKYRATAANIFMYLFEGMTKDELIQFFRDCSAEIKKHFNVKVLESIQEKKSEGYHTVICSGANTLLLNEITKYVSVDTVIGTELFFLDDETYDYDAQVVVVTGENKPKALLNRFKGIDIDWDNSFAFGDSYYDHDILNLTGNPVAVNPDERLKQIVVEKGWATL